MATGVVIPAGTEVRGWLGDSVAAGIYLAQFPAGEGVALVSADPNDFTATIDNPTFPLDPTVTYPAGFAAVASFLLEASATPSQPNVPVMATLSETGTAPAGFVQSAPDSEPVTVSLTEQEVLGSIFGAVMSVAAKVTGKAAVKPAVK